MCELLLHLSYDNTKTINNIIKNRDETSFSAFALSPSHSHSHAYSRCLCAFSFCSQTPPSSILHRFDDTSSQTTVAPHRLWHGIRNFHFPNQAQIHLGWHIIKHNKITHGIESSNGSTFKIG